MKKSYSVNIGGVIFHVDEDAFEKLQAYLDRLEIHFATTEGKDDIIADIEQRVSEMLIDKLGEENRVVTLSHIDEVISLLGEPAVFDESGGEQQAGQDDKGFTKRLYRNPEDKMLGGIAGGMGAYFNTDPLWFRIGFIVVALLSLGFGILFYIVLWAIIPEARTTAQRLEMRGEDINISNIEKNIKEEMEDLKRRFGKWKKEGTRKKKVKPDNLIETVGHGFVSLFVLFFRIIAGIIGFAFLLAIIALIVAVLIPGVSLHGFPLMYQVSLQDFLLSLTGSSLISSLLMVSMALILFLPLLGLLYAGIRVIFGFRKGNRIVGFGFSWLWVMALIFCAVISVKTINDFSKKGVASHKVMWSSDAADTLLLRLDDMPNIPFYDEQIKSNEFVSLVYDDKTDGYRIIGSPHFEIRQSHNDSIYIRTIKRARGGDPRKANLRTGTIEYLPHKDGDVIRLPKYFSTMPGEVLRKQRVKVNIYLPEGAVFYLDPDMQDAHTMIENFKPLWDKKMLSEFMVMKNNRLESVQIEKE